MRIHENACPDRSGLRAPIWIPTRSLPAGITATFSRIQFTPDLMPADITGVNVFEPRSAEFRFRPGPLFADVVLADEINRAPAKTQAALLEAMQEAQVSIDGESRELPRC